MMVTFPALIRTLGAATGIAISIAAVVSVPLGVWLALWHWIYDWFQGSFPEIPNVEIFGVLTNYPPLSWSGDRIPYPPPIFWIFTKTVEGMLIAVAAFALLHLVTPIRAKVRSISGLIPKKADDDHAMQLFLDKMAKRHNVKRRIRLWILPVPGVTAFVLSSPLRGHHVVISQGLIDHVPPEILQWILAHEVGHIVHGDTSSATLWMLAMRSIRLFDRIKHMALVAMFRTMFAIPLFKFILFPFYLLACAIMVIGRMGGRIGGTVFVLFDRWASRRMEFRADAFAARFVGPEHGIKLFSVLNGPFEPSFKLFATHPTPNERIKALQAQLRPTATEIGVAKGRPNKTGSPRKP